MGIRVSRSWYIGHGRYRASAFVGLISFALFTSPPAFAENAPAADEEEETTTSARLYRSPEEKREAGVGRKIMEWLIFKGLAETETEWQKEKRKDLTHAPSNRASSPALQFGLEAEITEQITAELIVEYDAELDTTEIDEAVLEFDTDYWSITAGRENINFGEYYSHFSTGPILEFGEVQADAITLGFKPVPGLEFFVYGFEGKAGKEVGDRSEWDFGTGAEWANDDESFVFGLGYLSDIGESDEGLFKDNNNIYEKRTAGINAYVLMAFERFEMTAEFLKTVDRIKGFDAEIDQPKAFNVELAILLSPRWQVALRWEGSRELEDEPKTQTGISSAWLLGKHLYLSIDYLNGRYQEGFVEDDQENELLSRQTIAAQLSYEF